MSKVLLNKLTNEENIMVYEALVNKENETLSYETDEGTVTVEFHMLDEMDEFSQVVRDLVEEIDYFYREYQLDLEKIEEESYELIVNKFICDMPPFDDFDWDEETIFFNREELGEQIVEIFEREKEFSIKVDKFWEYVSDTLKKFDSRTDGHHATYSHGDDLIKIRIKDHSWSDGAGELYGFSEPDYELVVTGENESDYEEVDIFISQLPE